MIREDHLKAVCMYLKSEFPDHTLEISLDSGLKAHRFHLAGQEANYEVTILDEVLSSLSVSEIDTRLDSFHLIEHLIDLPGTPLFVTESGLKLEYE